MVSKIYLFSFLFSIFLVASRDSAFNNFHQNSSQTQFEDFILHGIFFSYSNGNLVNEFCNSLWYDFRFNLRPEVSDSNEFQQFTNLGGFNGDSKGENIANLTTNKIVSYAYECLLIQWTGIRILLTRFPLLYISL